MQLAEHVSDLTDFELEELYDETVRNLSIEDRQFIESDASLAGDMLFSPKMVRARELFELLNNRSHV